MSVIAPLLLQVVVLFVSCCPTIGLIGAGTNLGNTFSIVYPATGLFALEDVFNCCSRRFQRFDIISMQRSFVFMSRRKRYLAWAKRRYSSTKKQSVDCRRRHRPR